MHLTPEQLREFESTLRAETQNIRTQLSQLDKEAEFGDDVDSFDEESDETEEFANKLGTKKALEERLAEVTAALDRVRKGSYGACGQCGRALSYEMLRLNPESSLCRECTMREA